MHTRTLTHTHTHTHTHTNKHTHVRMHTHTHTQTHARTHAHKTHKNTCMQTNSHAKPALTRAMLYSKAKSDATRKCNQAATTPRGGSRCVCVCVRYMCKCVCMCMCLRVYMCLSLWLCVYMCVTLPSHAVCSAQAGGLTKRLLAQTPVAQIHVHAHAHARMKKRTTHTRNVCVHKKGHVNICDVLISEGPAYRYGH